MTEDEAKTKWCPHARVAAPQPEAFSFNRGIAFNGQDTAPDIGPAALCLGTGCMAWREEVIDIATTPADGTADEKFPYDSGWRIVRSNIKDNTLEMKQVTGHGYCGLAGKP